MIFDKVETPDDLLIYLDKNLEYGVIRKDGKILNNSNDEDFQKTCNTDWRVRSCEEIVNSGVGHCYDQVEVERKWFELNKYEFKTYWISAYQENIENSGFSHAFLVYKDKLTNKWNLFEHADYFNRGILTFNSLEEAMEYRSKKQIEYATSQIKPKTNYTIFLTEFKKPKLGLNMSEYLDFVTQ